MNDPLVSVCVITYNHEPFIRKCLEGVMMQQTDFPFEVIVGEDCSTDGTRAIVQEFENRYPGIIKPVYHQKNVGGQRNGYEFCYPLLTGKYVAICEGDDYWTDPHKLQKQVEFLEKNPGFVFSFHRVSSVNAMNELLDCQEASAEPVLYNWKEIFHISIPTLSVVFRKCIHVIPEEMYKARSGDTFLFGLLARYGNAVDQGFIGAAYRLHNGGVYSNQNTIERFRQTILTRKLMKQSTLFNKEQKAEIVREILKRKILYCKYFLRQHDFRSSFRIMLA